MFGWLESKTLLCQCVKIESDSNHALHTFTKWWESTNELAWMKTSDVVCDNAGDGIDASVAANILWVFTVSYAP